METSPRRAPGYSSRPTVAYRLGLGLVVVGMVVLPHLYLALIGWVGWAVWSFAQHQFPAIWDWPTGHSRYGLAIKAVCALTPLAVGGASVIALLKPLFARRAGRMQPLALQREIEPRVYTLVQEVCAFVGAVPPRRIELSCDLNASAHFDRGWRGFFGDHMILTLGMPLVSGLTVRQLAGVIAHEFGHFRQGAGMRASYLIRRVNGWFVRVVYERDAWDKLLASAGETEDIWLKIVVWCAQAGVGLSRGVLWLLMMAGHALSGVLLRQMEYDADRWEMRVAGSAGFEATTLRLATLGSVLKEIHREIHREMRRSWHSNFQLPDNLPVLLQYRANHLPAESGRRSRTLSGWKRRAGWARTRARPIASAARERKRRKASSTMRPPPRSSSTTSTISAVSSHSPTTRMISTYRPHRIFSFRWSKSSAAKSSQSLHPPHCRCRR